MARLFIRKLYHKVSVSANLLINPVIHIYALFIKLRKKYSAPMDRSESALLLSPALAGGVGDNAMIFSSAAYLRELGCKKVTLVTFGHGTPWQKGNGLDDVIYLGTNLQLGFGSGKLKFVRCCLEYERFYCLGADMMDGYYSDNDSISRLELAELAHYAGLRSAVIGFSINNAPSAAAINKFHSLSHDVALCVRDPLSVERLRTISKHSIIECADVAFLLQPNDASELVVEIKNWVTQVREESQIIVGINIHDLLTGKLGNNAIEQLIRSTVSALEKFYVKNGGVAYLLIPHDTRKVKDRLSDVEVAHGIYNYMTPKIQRNTKIVPTPFSAAEIKAICSSLDFVVSGRMHLAIACLGQEVPVGGISYQGKFEGLFKHFEVDELTLSPIDAMDEGKFLAFLQALADRRFNLKQQIRKRLPYIIGLSKQNFSGP